VDFSVPGVKRWWPILRNCPDIWLRKTTRPVRTADDPGEIRCKYLPNKSHRKLRLNQQHAACAKNDNNMMLTVILTESELYVMFQLVPRSKHTPSRL